MNLRHDRQTLLTLTILAGLALALAALIAVLADSAAWNSILGWIQVQQRNLHQALAAAVKGLKAEGSVTSLAVLIGLSAAYGVLHAAGPGHGKAVISAYLVATGDTVRRGIFLAFLTSLAQGATAIFLVTVASWLLGLSARAMTQDATVLEQASYVMIAGLGLWLLAREIRPLLVGTVAAGPHNGHVHEHGNDCGHDHAAEAQVAAKPLTLTAVAGLVGSVGIRPCVGALLVLIFAFGQGLPIAGITAVLAMSLGTGATVAALAAATATARGPGLAMVFGDGSAAAIATRVLGFAGAAALTALGVMMFLASRAAPSSPFGL